MVCLDNVPWILAFLYILESQLRAAVNTPRNRNTGNIMNCSQRLGREPTAQTIDIGLSISELDLTGWAWTQSVGAISSSR